MENETRIARGRRDTLPPALLTAVGILAVLVVQQIIQAASLLSVFASRHADVLGHVGGTTRWFLAIALPFALGVFIALWLIVPIEAKHGVAQIIPRAIAAAGIGAGLVLLVLAGLAVASGMSFPGNLFGAYLPFAYDGWSVVSSLRGALHSAISLLVEVIPLVALATILESIWLRRQRSA